MKKRLFSLVLGIICVVSMPGIIGCSVDQTATSSQSTIVEQVPVVNNKIATPTPIPTGTFEPTTTVTPTEIPTTTVTVTPLPSATSTLTPTTTPEGIQPGVYATGGCIPIFIDTIHWVDWCVTTIEVAKDSYLIVNVTWTAHSIRWSPKKIIKHSDEGNLNMLLRDDREGRYEQINVGGAAANTITMEYNQPYFGWFLFPPLRNNAKIAHFYDNDSGAAIKDLNFETLIYSYIETPLSKYPYYFEYRSNLWEPIPNANGLVSFQLIDYPECQVLEWEPSPVQGKFKNTITIGKTTYDIYGWIDGNYSIREYLVTGEDENIDPQSAPFFHVIIPLEIKELCINYAGELLGRLYPTSP